MRTLTTLISILVPIVALATNGPLPAAGEVGAHESGRVRVADAGSTKIALDIPAGELAEALKALAKQTGTELVYRPEQVEGHKTPGLKGDYTAKDAIARLLKGTSLRASTDADTGAMLIAVPQPIASSLARDGKSSEAITLAQADQAMQKVGKSESSAGDSKKGAVASSAQNFDESSGDSANKAIPEIVVTAQKRAERLIETPMSVSVLSSDDLSRMGATQFRDFANSIPGLDYTTRGAGFAHIVLRGVSSGADAQAVVGVYLDDVPYGSSTGTGWSNVLTYDGGLFDLERIEVLRGPQGTLYGASTMGGLIKYVSKRPDVTRFGGEAQAGVSTTSHGGIGFNAGAALNAPFASGKAAVRLSGYETHDGGFTDNLSLRKQDVNRADIYGGRAEVMFVPTDALTIRITGMAQEMSRDGLPSVDYTTAGTHVPRAGDLLQLRGLTEQFDRRFRLASGVINYDMDWASFISISAYQMQRSEFVTDATPTYVPLFAGLGRQYSGVGVKYNIATENKFTQEVRLASRGGQTIDWLVGGFYDEEDNDLGADIVARDAAGQAVTETLLTSLATGPYREYAGFGNLTWHVTRKLDLTGGVRYARATRDSTSVATGLLASALNTPPASSTENVTTYMANARYKFTERATGYLRYATGYRPGGPNAFTTNPFTGAPIGSPQQNADSLKSYELGVKLETDDHRLGIDAAGYYIDWSNIQIVTVRNGFSTGTNAPDGAGIWGSELALTARPTDRFLATGSFAYQRARMNAALPELGAAKGEQLPDVPKFSGALNADYRLPVQSWEPTVGATVRHVARRASAFGPAAHRLPEYTILDLRAGFALKRVDLQLYLRNLLDKRAQLSSSTFGGLKVDIMEPRTIGLNMMTRF